MSHLPDEFVPLAASSNAPFAAFAHLQLPIFGIQFHPEVTDTLRGSSIIRNFAVDICEARQHWTMDEFIGKEIARIRQLVGEKGQVIGGYPRHMQRLHYANSVQALYLGESTLRFASYNDPRFRNLIQI